MLSSNRRYFLKIVGFSGFPGWSFYQATPRKTLALTSVRQASREWITTTNQFFVRSHLGIPSVNLDTWELTVDGNVSQPQAWTYSDLLQQPKESRTVTLECAENMPGGHMVGNARWTGIPLAHLLEKVGIKAGSQEIIFEGSDRGLDELEFVPVSYSRSLPLEEALANGTLVALEMNGKALKPKHGYPARAIVPGWYGMAHVKWLRRIKIVTKPYRGFYMSKRYYTARRHPNTGEPEVTLVSRMGVKSQIDAPMDGEILGPGAFVLRGTAWSGCRPVDRVEVSTNNGKSWSQAELSGMGPSCAWILWSHPWVPPAPGQYTLQVRAFDTYGNTQPQLEDPGRINRYDNRWIHRVKCTITDKLVPMPSQSPGAKL